MRLNWLLARLRRGPGGPVGPRLLAADRLAAGPLCTPAGSRPTAVVSGPGGRRGRWLRVRVGNL